MDQAMQDSVAHPDLAHPDVPHGGAARAGDCAAQLESEILAGLLLPGDRLDEVALAGRLGVSRNTLREAFRLLADEQLVEHLPHRGVFVRRIGEQEAREVYEVRRHLELGSLERLQERIITGEEVEPDALRAVQEAVADGMRAREADDWVAVGTANARFHQALVALGGNRVAARMVRQLLSVTRLRFFTVGDPRTVHERFLDENDRIAKLLLAGHVARARTALELYLLDAEGGLAHD